MAKEKLLQSLRLIGRFTKGLGRLGKQQVNLNTLLLSALAFFAHRYVNEMDARDAQNAAAINSVSIQAWTNTLSLTRQAEKVEALEEREGKLERRIDHTDSKVNTLSQRVYIIEQRKNP